MSQENGSNLERQRQLVEAAHRSAVEQHTALGDGEPVSVPLAELPKGTPAELCFQEWNTYLREAGRLIAEGHEGQFVLIKDENIVGIFASRESALTEGAKRFLPRPFLVQQIHAAEPILRIRGYNVPWPSSASPLAKPA